jgi:selenium metabolism protein YedF
MNIEPEFLLVIKSCYVGDSEPDLGETLMRSFLNMIWEGGVLPARIICMTSGVFLTTEGSQVVDILKRFEEQGTEILSCGTCLDYYHRKEKLIIGKPTTMKESVNAMLSFKKVVYA